ncbi:MAG: toxin-antitoxin system HicB family antitoxin [Syntrophales bacterium]|nr:toxin-antitoxin system HicB family antitoxin [Syntrophales bacterium]MDP3097373.1 toxin-antitoxin system HicB family antitoxin [Syntrophales bacterium]
MKQFFLSMKYLANDLKNHRNGLGLNPAKGASRNNVINDMKHTGEEILQPIACKRYSGKFMVRVPPEVHRNLAIQASESSVSLNRIARAKLSR